MASKTKPLCGAITSSGNPCKHPAGFKTEHQGEGRCYRHGGCSPVKHGRYSKLSNPLGIKIQERLGDINPLDMIPELALLKAMLDRWIEKNGEDDKMASAMAGAIPLVDGIRKTVDTIHKMQTRDLLTSRELETAIQQLILIITEEVKDPDAIQRISTRFASAFNVRAESTAGAIKHLE